MFRLTAPQDGLPQSQWKHSLDLSQSHRLFASVFFKAFRIAHDGQVVRYEGSSTEPIHEAWQSFYSYAETKWPEHFRRAGIEAQDPLTLKAVQRCVEESRQILALPEDDAFQPSSGLNRAAAYGTMNVVECCLEHGADIETMVDNRIWPGYSTSVSDSKDAAAAVNMSLLEGAIESASTDLACMLLSRGANPLGKHIIHRTPLSPLHKATAWGQYEVVQALVKHGAPVDATYQPIQTPLMLAIVYEWKLTIELF